MRCPPFCTKKARERLTLHARCDTVSIATIHTHTHHGWCTAREGERRSCSGWQDVVWSDRQGSDEVIASGTCAARVVGCWRREGRGWQASRRCSTAVVASANVSISPGVCVSACACVRVCRVSCVVLQGLSISMSHHTALPMSHHITCWTRVVPLSRAHPPHKKSSCVAKIETCFCLVSAIFILPVTFGRVCWACWVRAARVQPCVGCLWAT
jgi:hypothetical protein